MLLRDAYAALYEPQKLRGKSPKTKKKYGFELDRFDRALMRPATVDDLKDDAVALIIGMMMEDGSAAATANKFRSCVLALWRFLARKGIVESWPDVAKLVEPTRIPRAWSENELHRLFNACRNSIGRIAHCRACDWWCALLAVLWDTGERIGALLEAQWDDVNLDSGWIIVRAETRKGGRADKASQLHPNTVALLRRIQQDSGAVFPWDRCESLLWTRYGRILKRAGLPNDRKSKFHRVRKSVATHLTVLGGNATEAMGHSSPAVTRAYIDPTIARTPQPADVLFRIDQVNWDRVRPLDDG